MAKVSQLKVRLDSEEKREVYEKIKHKPQNRDYYERLARLCEKGNNIEDAERVLRFGLLVCPKDRHLKEQLAHLYMTNGDEARAVDILKQLIRKHPVESWSSYLRLGRIYKERGEMEKAVAVFQSIDPKSPLKERSHENLYTLFFIMQDHDRGIKSLREVIRRFGENHRRTKDLGRLYMKKGNKIQAIKWLKKSLKYEPDDMDARIFIGLAYLDAGEYGNARRTFKRVLKLKRGSYPALINLAELSLLQGRLAEAKKILMQIRRKDPTDSRSKVGLGEYWLKKGKPEKAIPITEKGLGETPFYYPMELVRAHAILGEAYGRLGNNKMEIVHKAISKRLALGADPFDAMMGLRKIYRKEGKFDLAEEVLNQILATFPGNALVLLEMARAQFDRGMAGKAIALCQEALKEKEEKFIRDRIEALKLLARIYRGQKMPGKAREQEKLAAEMEK